MSREEELAKYKTIEDVYKAYPLLSKLKTMEIVNSMLLSSDEVYRRAVEALMILDRKRFIENEGTKWNAFSESINSNIFGISLLVDWSLGM